MKRCPECGRDYNDDSLSFCLDDGSELLFGPASMDESATAILHDTASPSEAATRAHLLAAEQMATLPNTIAEDQRSTTFDKRLFPALAALAVIVLGGFFTYRYLGASSKQIESIAVMPFVNESGNADVEYLSDGMTETLIGSLSQIENLSVKARSSVFRFKGKETPAQTVGKELNVQAILTGRVVQRGDQLAVSLELVDASTENSLWSKRYDRKTSDLVALTTEIARDVSTKLKSKLSGADAAKVTKNYTTNPAAYQLYLKGRLFWNRRTPDSLRQAAEYYKQAIELDPNYARAYAGLAETYSLYGIYHISPPGESMPEAKAMAMRALEIDDSLADAHTALGNYSAYYERDWASAEREFRKAIALDPNYATAYQWLGNSVLNPNKRFDEGLAALRRAEELDPLSPVIGTNLADTFVYMRNYDDAIAKNKGVLALDPNFAFGRYALGLAYHLSGAYDDAITEYRRSLELSYDPETNASLAAALAKAGHRDEAATILRQLKEESLRRYVPNYPLAVVCFGLGQNDEALDLLEKAVAAREPYTTWLAVDPMFHDLRAEPRYKALLKQMNLPE